jgi:hypothetical protein
MRQALAFALLAALGCRQQMLVDTSESAFIPRDVALDGLKEVLLTADGAPPVDVDDEALELRPPGRVPLRVAFKDLSATRLDKVALYYQVRLFTPERPDILRLNWTSEAPARRALELIDALRGKT